MDSLCELTHEDICGKRKNKSKPSSTDALEFQFKNDKFKVYLIEFKRLDTEKPSEKEELKALITKIKDDSGYSEFIKTLRFIQTYLDDMTSLDLKLKPFESLFSVIPHLCKMQFKDEYSDILEHLINNCEHRYIVVSNVNSPTPNKNSRHYSFQMSFKSIKRLEMGIFEEILLFDVKQFNSFISQKS